VEINKESLRNRIERLILDFVAVKTDTNSVHENNIKDFFGNWFDSVPYFAANKDYCGLYDIPNDPLNRVVPWALVKGCDGSLMDTIILIHHCDTVNTEDYKNLENMALDPLKLTQALRRGAMEVPTHVQKDAACDNWLFGRGVADMKGGGAIHMALLEEYAAQALNGGFKGNVLLLSLVDEENLSAGMIGAVHLLKQLKDKFGLNYVLTIDSEAHEREDENLPIYYDGSIGKAMPVVYVRGVLAHSGMIYKGLNPINLLAEIIRKTELNPDFIEKFGNSVCPPPTWLYHKDSKKVYDVSLPDAALGYMSVLTLSKTPKEFMDTIHDICTDAFEQVIADMRRSFQHWVDLNDGKVEAQPAWSVNVKTFAQLHTEAVRDSGDGFLQVFAQINEEIRKKLLADSDFFVIDGINEVIKTTLSFVKDKSPIVVLALSPPYYPAVSNAMLGEKAAKVNAIVSGLEGCQIKNIYTGISDLSYSMFTADDDAISYIEDNMLMWGHSYTIPIGLIKELSTPILNIGPWGKDIHKYTERVFLPDLFYEAPRVTDFVVRKMLS